MKAKKLKYDYALYARSKNTFFSSRLMALWSVIFWSDVGKEFHAVGQANAKLRSPNLRRYLPVVHSVHCSQNVLLSESVAVV